MSTIGGESPRMVQRTEHQEHKVSEFYDGLASDFDRMTAFEKRLDSEKPFYRTMVERHGVASALDAGAGTGFHSILLAGLGVKVTAVDLSTAMLAALRHHAEEKGLSVGVLRSSFRDLPTALHSSVDAVFCMGNTLAHMLEERDLQETFVSFHRVIKPGGSLFIQILNFERILSDPKRAQNVRESGGVTYVRYYTVQDDRLMFHVRRTSDREGMIEERHSSVTLKPWLMKELTAHISRAGFCDVETFGSIALDRFGAHSSKDLVIIARRGSEDHSAGVSATKPGDING